MFKRTMIASLVRTTTPPLLLVGTFGLAGAAYAVDTGDAPDSYGLATHAVLDNAAYLGRIRPDDNEPAASVGADADDIANGDDEDGVFAFPILVEFAKEYTTNVFATNPGPGEVTLVGWVDFDGNGTFDADEAASAVVPAGSDNEKYKLIWSDLSGVSSEFIGTTYARFRITSDGLGPGNATGSRGNGEVEDYTLEILADNDGDEIPDVDDPDDDNDGIPDEVEVIGTDTDGDGVPNFLDPDSDDDGIPDFVEAGPNPSMPADTDADGSPDYVDLDSDNDGVPDGQADMADIDGDGMTEAVEGAGDSDGDGILNVEDLDSDNDSIPDAIEAGNPDMPVDTDGDGIPDFLDLDSDSDGIPDLYEASSGEIDAAALDADGDGRLDPDGSFGANGLLDDVETTPDSGVPIFAIADTDGDGQRDYQDLDSDNDGLTDLTEAGGPDVDGDGRVDELVDTDTDGIPDNIDVDSTGGVDADDDNIDDSFDADFATGDDLDGDGIIDTADIDLNNDGIIDGSNLLDDGALPDADEDGRPDFQDDAFTPVDPDDAVVTDPGTDPVTEPVTDPGANPVTGVDTANTEEPEILTGLDGAPGCSISTAGIDGPRDPVFLLALLAAIGAILRGRRKPVLRRIRVRRSETGK